MDECRKILFVITHLELGGAQTQLYTLIQGLDRNRFSVFLCAGDGFLKKKFTELPGIRCYFIKELTRPINLFLDMRAFIKLYRYIKKHRFDIVHTHSPKASFLARWAAYCAGVKHIVYTVHGWPFHAFMNPFIYSFYWMLEKLSSFVTKRFITVSGADKETGIRKNIAPAPQFSLIHYGVDTGIYNRTYGARVACARGKPLIFTVSALKPQKGLYVFLRAAQYILSEYPQAKFIIAGDGFLRGKIQKRIRRLGIAHAVSLIGWSADIPSYFTRASLFMLSSLWEGLPVALIEAVLSGVPCVVTDTGGVNDIFADGVSGILVAPGNAAGLAAASIRILKKPGYWSRIVTGSRQRLNAEHWSFQRMVLETEKLYGELEG